MIFIIITNSYLLETKCAHVLVHTYTRVALQYTVHFSGFQLFFRHFLLQFLIFTAFFHYYFFSKSFFLIIFFFEIYVFTIIYMSCLLFPVHFALARSPSTGSAVIAISTQATSSVSRLAACAACLQQSSWTQTHTHTHTHIPSRLAVHSTSRWWCMLMSFIVQCHVASMLLQAEEVAHSSQQLAH